MCFAPWTPPPLLPWPLRLALRTLTVIGNPKLYDLPPCGGRAALLGADQGGGRGHSAADIPSKAPPLPSKHVGGAPSARGHTPQVFYAPTNLHGPLKSMLSAFRFLGQTRRNPFFFSGIWKRKWSIRASRVGGLPQSIWAHHSYEPGL